MMNWPNIRPDQSATQTIPANNFSWSTHHKIGLGRDHSGYYPSIIFDTYLIRLALGLPYLVQLPVVPLTH